MPENTFTHETATSRSILHLKMDIAGVLILIKENHDAEMVVTALMKKLWDTYNQTGIPWDQTFLSGWYWQEIERRLQEKQHPESASSLYTHEFILAQELQDAHYTAQETGDILLKMREKEATRQRTLRERLRTSRRVWKIIDCPEPPNNGGTWCNDTPRIPHRRLMRWTRW